MHCEIIQLHIHISRSAILAQCHLLFVLCNLSVLPIANGTYICLQSEYPLCTITKNKERSLYFYFYAPFPKLGELFGQRKQSNQRKRKLNIEIFTQIESDIVFFRDMSYTFIHSRYGMRICRLCMFNKCFPIHYNQFLWLYGI